jgi:hypothetical protein
MYLIGDVHANIGKYRKILKSLPEGSKSIQLGDMGLGFAGVHLHPVMPGHMFIRGNHDDPKACQKNPAYLGEYGYLPFEDIFYMGGAWSIDYMYRTPGVSWWPDEELSAQQLESAWELYCKAKPKIVVTHEAPLVAGLWMLSQCTLPKTPPDALCNVAKDENYDKYKKELGQKETRTGRKLQDMLDVHVPDKWFFGHYHKSETFSMRGCEFRCLAELELGEV